MKDQQNELIPQDAPLSSLDTVSSRQEPLRIPIHMDEFANSFPSSHK